MPSAIRHGIDRGRHREILGANYGAMASAYNGGLGTLFKLLRVHMPPGLALLSCPHAIQLSKTTIV